MGPGFNVVGTVKRFGGIQHQLFGLIHRLAQAIGKAAVGIGHGSALFQQQNFSLFVQPPQPGCCTGAACIAANNDILHGFTLLFFQSSWMPCGPHGPL